MHPEHVEPQNCFRNDSPCQDTGNVTALPILSRHVTGNVTGDFEKNLGKTELVTLSRLKGGCLPLLAHSVYGEEASLKATAALSE